MSAERRSQGFRVHHLVLIAMVAAFNTLVSIVSSMVPMLPGMGLIYLPLGFMYVFGGWFGIWAVIGGILSGILYAPYWGTSPFYGLLMSLVSDGIFALMSWVAFKAFRVDPELKSTKDYVVWIVGLVLISIITAFTYGWLMIAVFGWITWDLFWATIIPGQSGLIAGIPISLILLKTLSKYVKRTQLYVRGWLF